MLLIAILAPALLRGQDRIELGYQTTKRGIVWYRNGLPTHTPAYRLARDTNAVLWVDTLTALRYDWDYAGDAWRTKGVFTQSLPPLPTQTSGAATIDNRTAFWRPASGNNILHRYDFNQTAWVPVGDWFYRATAPSNVASGGSNGAAVYTTSLWQDSDDQIVRYWDGDSWEPFAVGGSVVVIDLVSEFATYPTAAGEELIVWRDQTRGGVFVSQTSGAANGGTIFAGTGSTKWHRITQDSRLNVKWWGATGDGTTDDSAPLQAAGNYAANNNGHLYSPLGTYITSSTIALDSFARLVVSGDGPNLSIWKRKDSTTGTLNRIMRIDGAGGDYLTVRDMGYDGNSTNQATPSPSTQFQQYHNLYILPSGDRGFAEILLQNINSYNPLGDGIGINGSSSDGVGQVNIVNVYEENRLYTRSSITITANFDAVNITNFEGPVIEVEPNGFSGSYKYALNIANAYLTSEIDLNLLGARAAGRKGTLNLTNVRGKVTSLVIQEFDTKADNLHFETAGEFRMAYGSYIVSDSYFKADSLFNDNAIVTQASANPTDLAVFTNCVFDKHGSATITDGYYWDDNAFGTNTERVKFQNCRFLSGVKTAEVRSGRFEFINCYHTYADTSAACIDNGGSANKSGVTNEILLRDNYVPEWSYLFRAAEAGNAQSIRVSGGNAREGRNIRWGRFDKINAPKGAGTQINVAENSVYFQDNRTQLSAGGLPITGHWVKGDVLYYADPDDYSYIGVVCDTSGRADGTSATGATAGAKFKKFGFILNITPYDASATNEAWTIDADDADTELITTQTVKFEGAGGATTDYDPGTNTLVITAGGSGDGNGIYGDGVTPGSGSDNLPPGGSTVTMDGDPLIFETVTPGGTVTTVLDMETDNNIDDRFTNWLRGKTNVDSLKIYAYDGQEYVEALSGNLNLQSDEIVNIAADSVTLATVAAKTKVPAITGISAGGTISKISGTTNNDILIWSAGGWTVGAAPGGGGVTGTGTANRVAYWTGASTIAADDDFRFDGTRVGIQAGPVAGFSLHTANAIRTDGLFVSRGAGNGVSTTSAAGIRLIDTTASTGDTWNVYSSDNGELIFNQGSTNENVFLLDEFGGAGVKNYLNLQTPTAAASTAPNGLHLYTTDAASHEVPVWVNENGEHWTAMESESAHKWAKWSATGNGTAVSLWTVANSESGTATTRNVASTNLFTSMRRLGYVTAASGSSVAGTRHNQLSFFVSNASGFGGFHYTARFGFSTANTTNKQAFIGLRNSTAAIAGNTNASALTNCVGFGIDATQTTLRFVYNDASGTASTVNLGANFPTNTTDADMYEIRIFSPPNSIDVFYYCKNLSTGNTASGQVSGNLPAETAYLCPVVWIGNGTDATAVGIDLVQYSVLTNY